jgi:hypothetical protein
MKQLLVLAVTSVAVTAYWLWLTTWRGKAELPVESSRLDVAFAPAPISAAAVDAEPDTLPVAAESQGKSVPQNKASVTRFDRAAAASSFGLADRGSLDEAGIARVETTIKRAMEGATKELEKAAAADDAEQACLVMLNILKYQEALSMLARGEYVVVDPFAIPKTVPEGYDPTILFNAAQVDGKAAGVMLPIRVQAGTDLDIAARLSKEFATVSVDVAVAEFNGQDQQTRRARIEEMLRARALVSQATIARRRGEISSAEFDAQTKDWIGLRPPRGTAIDAVNFMLRRL